MLVCWKYSLSFWISESRFCHQLARQWQEFDGLLDYYYLQSNTIILCCILDYTVTPWISCAMRGI